MQLYTATRELLVLVVARSSPPHLYHATDQVEVNKGYELATKSSSQPSEVSFHMAVKVHNAFSTWMHVC